MCATIVLMHATDVKAIAAASRKKAGPAEKDSAARLTALMHHVFLYDRGNQLRVIEETGPSISRAVDALVKAKLATRVEDPDDRRVRRVEITAQGKDLVATLVTVRMSGIESFVATLSAAQRRKLDAAVEALLDREDLAQTYEALKGSERT